VLPAWAAIAATAISTLGTILSAYIAARARDTNRKVREFHDRWSHNGD
jgi:hypothetical protein